MIYKKHEPWNISESHLKDINTAKTCKRRVRTWDEFVVRCTYEMDSIKQMDERFLKLKNAIKIIYAWFECLQYWIMIISVFWSLLGILHPLQLSFEALSRKDADPDKPLAYENKRTVRIWSNLQNTYKIDFFQ